MLSGNLLSPKLDVVFKTLFTRNPQHLKSFLSDMLNIPEDSIKKLELINTEVQPDLPSEKQSRLDICLHLDDKKVDIEIQVKNNHDFVQRSLFYWSKLYTSGLKKGESYLQLRRTISLNILDYVQFPDRKPAHAKVLPMFTDTHEVFSHYQEMHFFELPKIKFPLESEKTLDKMTAQERWLLFLNIRGEEDLTMLYNTNNEKMRQFIDDYKQLCQDEALQLQAVNREMALMDYNSDMIHARAEGLKEGKAEGLKEGKAEGLKEGMAKGKAEGLEEGMTKGKAEGLEEGRIKTLIQLIDTGALTMDIAANTAGMTPHAFADVMEQYKRSASV